MFEEIKESSIIEYINTKVNKRLSVQKPIEFVEKGIEFLSSQDKGYINFLLKMLNQNAYQQDSNSHCQSKPKLLKEEVVSEEPLYLMNLPEFSTTSFNFPLARQDSGFMQPSLQNLEEDSIFTSLRSRKNSIDNDTKEGEPKVKRFKTEVNDDEDSVSSTGGRGSKRWTEREEIFLSGIVMDVYYRRHSLKPTKAEKEEAKNAKLSCEMLVWQEIGRRYNLARERFEEIMKKSTAKRTVKSLQRHWKETGSKSKYNESVDIEDELPLTKQREIRWDEEYNISFILSGTHEHFEQIKSNEAKVSEYKRIHKK